MPIPPVEVEPPTHGALVRDLGIWRQHGVLTLRRLELPALRRAALASGAAATAAEAAEPAVLTELVRSSIAPIANSVTGRCALVMLGLDPETFDLMPNLLREDAAQIYGVSVERFRRDPQDQVVATVTDRILERCFVHRARLARLAMEGRRPADARLAVKWLERFEAYFRLWTPIYALGADLTAYRSTLLEADRAWDWAPGAEGPDDPGYSQELQAAGYGTNALFRLACVTAEQARFVASHGGLWVLSTPEAEVEARDALIAVTQSTPVNERELSWLRGAIEDSSDEMHPFLEALRVDAIGLRLHDDWQRWLAYCNCTWDEIWPSGDTEYFPTARYCSGVAADCSVHRTITACNAYCTLLEQQWIRVADWYSPPLASG